MISALDSGIIKKNEWSGTSGLGSERWRQGLRRMRDCWGRVRHCIVFLGKTLILIVPLLIQVNTGEFLNIGGRPAMD